MNEEIPKWKLAYVDYEKGLKYKDIADKYEVSISAIKSWKSRYWTNEKLQPKSEKVATKNAKGCNQNKGGQVGNKNAIGNNGGAPKGNKNNLRHGIYSLLNTNALSEEEKEAMRSKEDLDTIKELETQVGLCDVLISRYLNKIAELKTGKEVSPTNISKKVKKFTSETSSHTQEETEQSYVYVDEKIEKINEALAKQIKIKGKLLKDIEDIKNSRKKVDVDMINGDLVEDWVRGVYQSE